MNKLILLLISTVLITKKPENTSARTQYTHYIDYIDSKGSHKTITETCTTTYHSRCYKTDGPRVDVGDYICDATGSLYLHPKGNGTNMRDGTPLLQQGLTCTTGLRVTKVNSN